MLLLAFDTATPAVTVAVHDGSQVVAEESAVDARRHGELLAVAIDRVLRTAGARQADLTAVAVGTGPGPYTGLRAGLVTAAVLSSALAIPADGICTLDVIAAAAAAGREFLVATDARRREVYWARYDGNGQRLAGPFVGKPADLPAGMPVAGPARPCTPSWPNARRSRCTRRRPRWPSWPRPESQRASRRRRPSRCTCAGPMRASRGRASA